MIKVLLVLLAVLVAATKETTSHVERRLLSNATNDGDSMFGNLTSRRNLGGSGLCLDSSDARNGHCDSYGDCCDEYHNNEHWCGHYDTDKFDSRKMCCACNGGKKHKHVVCAEIRNSNYLDDVKIVQTMEECEKYVTGYKYMSTGCPRDFHGSRGFECWRGNVIGSSTGSVDNSDCTGGHSNMPVSGCNGYPNGNYKLEYKGRTWGLGGGHRGLLFPVEHIKNMN